MTTTTPGRRLHAALLANGIISYPWNHYEGAVDAAAREYEGGRAHDPERALCWRVERSDAPEPAFVVTSQSGSIRVPLDAGLARNLIAELGPHAAEPPTIDGRLADAANARADIDTLLGRVNGLHGQVGGMWDAVHALRRGADAGEDVVDALRDRLDALTTEVAALRRDRDNDDAAFAEVGDRITEVEADLTALGPTISDIYRRLSALEVRAIDGWLADAANADDARDRLDALRERTTETQQVVDSHSDRLDALTTEVAALRRDRDNDDAAFAEVGDRLARIGASIEQNADDHAEFFRRIVALEARAIDGGDPLRRNA